MGNAVTRRVIARVLDAESRFVGDLVAVTGGVALIETALGDWMIPLTKLTEKGYQIRWQNVEVIHA